MQPATPPPAAVPWWRTPWLGLLVVAGLAIAGLAGVVYRRRRAAPDAPEPVALQTAVAEVAPPVAEPVAAAPETFLRPRLELDFSVARAGIDGDQLAVHFEIEVRNGGEVPAEDVRLHVELRTASAGLAPPVAGPVPAITRPMVAPFVLAPGAEAQFAATAVLPVARIHRLTLAGRPLCVPLILLSASYRWPGGGKAELGVDYLLGIDQPGNPRLGPIWLDLPPRLYDRIGMRVHGEVRKH